MAEMCWDVNPNCMAKAEGPEKRPCPAFEQKINCWELDSKPMLEKVSEEQKKMMVTWLEENCPKCPVYGTHQAEVDKKLSEVRGEA